MADLIRLQQVDFQSIQKNIAKEKKILGHFFDPEIIHATDPQVANSAIMAHHSQLTRRNNSSSIFRGLEDF